MNDGSTDDSPTILRKYTDIDKRVIVIDKVNGGQSSARNTGLDAAKGQWCMFVDSDDWIEPDAVETTIHTALETGSDVIAFDYICEYKTRSEIRYYSSTDKIYTGDELFLRVLGPRGSQLSEPEKLDAMSIVCAKLYRRNVVCENRFVDLSIIGTSEDTLFNLSVLRHITKAAYIRYGGYHYRKTNENATTQKYKSGLIDKWQNLYDRITKFVSNPEEEDAFHNRIAYSIIGAGINEMRSSQSFFHKRKWVKNTLSSPRYYEAYRRLDLQQIKPLKWKLFFACAKFQLYSSVTVLLYVMNKILVSKKM